MNVYHRVYFHALSPQLLCFSLKNFLRALQLSITTNPASVCTRSRSGIRQQEEPFHEGYQVHNKVSPSFFEMLLKTSQEFH